jgi:TIR domain-containing protein
MTQVFVSYRRADTQHVTDRITDRLKGGSFSIFKDVTSIKPGQDFRREIETALGKCEVLVAVIGNRWLGQADESGQHRIKQDDDYVRYEVRAALERGVPLIPVLIDAADCLPAMS